MVREIREIDDDGGKSSRIERPSHFPCQTLKTKFRENEK